MNIISKIFCVFAYWSYFLKLFAPFFFFHIYFLIKMIIMIYMLPIWQVVLGLTFTTLMSIIGGSFAFFVKKDINPKFQSVFLGFAAGVMLAATIFSLIIPGLNDYDTGKIPKVVPLIVGIIAGVLLLFLFDRIIPHIHGDKKEEGPVKTKMKTSTKLLLADSIHNIPEGLAIGLTFGMAMNNANAAGTTVLIPVILSMALGMGIQNLPETAAVSLALKQETGSKWKAFGLVTVSALVELVFAIAGIFLSGVIKTLMPWFLAFAAGAMIYVVVDELIPQYNRSGYPSWGTWGLIAGFVLMLALETIQF